jgi:predicted adenine nucleotide alpha hydrolase (AANH) superfamily ATPase
MKKHKQELQVPLEQERVLLHTCCAPCSSAIIEFLMANRIEPVIYYCNPNIYPYEEYLIRKNECTRYAKSLGLTIIDADYDHQAWLDGVKGMENEPERGGRCSLCFRMRLLDTAEYARNNGFRVITTTLASSRWKSLEQIDAAGKWACAKANAECPDRENDVIWWDRNWRKGGLQERRNQIIREYDFYNQLWCGCEFSRRQQEF